MKLKGLIDEDFINYKQASMFLIFPSCSFKCCIEAGCDICQNMPLASSAVIEYNTEELVKRYLDNPITHSIVCGGLEPLDSFEELLKFINILRTFVDDPVIIYTGYWKSEIEDKLNELKKYKNIIIKFGRFIPNKEKHYDEVLGVELANPEQYAEKIS